MFYCSKLIVKIVSLPTILISQSKPKYVRAVSQVVSMSFRFVVFPLVVEEGDPPAQPSILTSPFSPCFAPRIQRTLLHL